MSAHVVDAGGVDRHMQPESVWYSDSTQNDTFRRKNGSCRVPTSMKVLYVTERYTFTYKIIQLRFQLSMAWIITI